MQQWQVTGDRWEIVSFRGENTTWGNYSAILHMHRKTFPQQNISWCFSKFPLYKSPLPFLLPLLGDLFLRSPHMMGWEGVSLCACWKQKQLPRSAAMPSKQVQHQNMISLCFKFKIRGEGKQRGNVVVVLECVFVLVLFSTTGLFLNTRQKMQCSPFPRKQGMLSHRDRVSGETVT